MTSEPIDRPAARVILIGPDARTLLFRGGDPGRPLDGTWWFTPGGGVDPGESAGDAARRELWEETGQVDVEWGGLVALRHAVFDFMGATYRSFESFFVVHAPTSEVSPMAMTALEQDWIVEHRWLDTAGVQGLTEPMYPVQLGSVLDDLGLRRYPAEPWSWVD